MDPDAQSGVRKRHGEGGACHCNCAYQLRATDQCFAIVPRRTSARCVSQVSVRGRRVPALPVHGIYVRWDRRSEAQPTQLQPAGPSDSLSALGASGWRSRAGIARTKGLFSLAVPVALCCAMAMAPASERVRRSPLAPCVRAQPTR